MPCLDTENTPLPGDTENVLLRKLLNRLCNVTSGGGGGVSQAYVDAQDAATLLSANNNAVAGDITTLAAAMSSASALYVLKAGDTMTGVLLQPAGSVGAPALARSTDTDTGLWYPAANTFAISTGGAERVRIDSAGFVGIGTPAPLTKLNVIDTISTSPRGILSSQISTDTNGAQIGFSKARGSLGFEATVNTGDVLGRLMFRGHDGSSYLEMASIEVGASGTVAFTRVPTFMTFSTATNAAPSVLTERMRIDNAGNVGIGIAVPLARLHVTPAVSGTDYFRIDHSDGTPRFQMGVLPLSATFGTVWLGSVVPATANATLMGDGTNTILNAPTGGDIYFASGFTTSWRITTAGHLIAHTDNTYDIGAPSATRPRNVYVSSTVLANNFASDSFFYWPGKSQISSPSDGLIEVTDSAGTSFNRLQFGGTTSSFPSIKRNGAGIDFRLADDSAYASITAQNITQATAGLFSVTSGANQRAGNAVLVAGTVTVGNTTVTANTIVMLTRKTSGGTLGTAITYTVTAATSFTITSDSALDTSTFSYFLIEVP